MITAGRGAAVFQIVRHGHGTTVLSVARARMMSTGSSCTSPGSASSWSHSGWHRSASRSSCLPASSSRATGAAAAVRAGFLQKHKLVNLNKPLPCPGQWQPATPSHDRDGNRVTVRGAGGGGSVGGPGRGTVTARAPILSREIEVTSRVAAWRIGPLALQMRQSHRLCEAEGPSPHRRPWSPISPCASGQAKKGIARGVPVGRVRRNLNQLEVAVADGPTST